MSEVAYAYDEEYNNYEVIDGVEYMMARPSVQHMRVERNILTAFTVYLKGKKCQPFNEVDVYFDDDNNFIPDVMIVCNPDIVKPRGIFGTPDLIVEIASPSTAINDRMKKFNAYERYGVKEYWIVSPEAKSVEVYLNHEGKFVLDGYYQFFTDEDYNELRDWQKAINKREIKVSLYDDLVLTLADIFEDVS